MGSIIPDLLPIPRSDEALLRVVDNIQRAQDAIKRTILLENPSHYLEIPGHEYDEIDFLTELCRRTDCKLLLDVNNVYVSANNLGFDAQRLYRCGTRPATSPKYISPATHADPTLGTPLLIDSHDAPISRAGLATLRATHRENRHRARH